MVLHNSRSDQLWVEANHSNLMQDDNMQLLTYWGSIVGKIIDIIVQICRDALNKREINTNVSKISLNR